MKSLTILYCYISTLVLGTLLVLVEVKAIRRILLDIQKKVSL